MLCGKNILLGVSGGIACYKSCEIVSRLKKMGANVDVIMTQHALEFVRPLTFETLSKTQVVTDMFAPKKNLMSNIFLLQKKLIFLLLHLLLQM